MKEHAIRTVSNYHHAWRYHSSFFLINPHAYQKRNRLNDLPDEEIKQKTAEGNQDPKKKIKKTKNIITMEEQSFLCLYGERVSE